MKPSEFPKKAGGSPLDPEGECPRIYRPAALARALPLLALLGVGVPACATDDGQQVLPPTVLGMTDQIAPSYSDDQITLYTVTMPVPLPVRRPSNGERAALGPAAAPYPSAPFLVASDTRVEIRFTLTNVDDKQQSVELLLDPWNEFVHYKPGVVVVDEDETTPNLSGFDKFFVLPPKGRVVGTITADDTHELAVDLSTAENIIANPPAEGDDTTMGAAELVNRAFNLQNRSNTGDPVLTPWIPSVIAGLTGFDLGLRTYAPANVAVEIIVDVADLHGDRVIPVGDTATPMGMPPTELTLPGAK